MTARTRVCRWPGARCGGLAVLLAGACSVWAPASRADDRVAAPPDTAASAARPPTAQQRKAVLDAVRPLAARRTGQAVRIRVERMNIDAGWALLAGELVAPDGGALAWERVAGCQPELDKGLWAVLQQRGGRWVVRQLQVCAPEPPLWGAPDAASRHWPCGLFAGLPGPEGQDLQAACLRRPAQGPRP